MANLYQSYQAAHGAEAVKDAQTPSKTLRLPDMRGMAQPDKDSILNPLAEALGAQFPALKPCALEQSVEFSAEQDEPKGKVSVYTTGSVVLTGALKSFSYVV
jgi:hypothetical protein